MAVMMDGRFLPARWIWSPDPLISRPSAHLHQQVCSANVFPQMNLAGRQMSAIKPYTDRPRLAAMAAVRNQRSTTSPAVRQRQRQLLRPEWRRTETVRKPSALHPIVRKTT